MHRLGLAFALCLCSAGCSDQSSAPNTDGGPHDLAGRGGGDGGTNGSCAPLGSACTNDASCCSGATCDTASKTCAYLGLCRPTGASCNVATDCCTLTCTAGACGAACKQLSAACAASADCCSGNCAAGACAPVVAGGCTTLGNACTSPAGCCSGNCQGGACAPSGGPCLAQGDTCYRASDCCTNVCNQPNGANSAGTCGSIQTMGSGGCTLDGEPCNGCSGCCSRTCVPTSTGGRICQPASGCKLEGDLCVKDTDCCGGGATGLPGANSVTCIPIAGTTFGACHNATGNQPEGDVCGFMGASICGQNAREDCAGCMSPKYQCCKLDSGGVPRCFGGSTMNCPKGYDGTANCCIAAMQICAFSAECCNGAPCVADMNGVLRCGSACSMAGGPCRADGDCCAGLVCNVPTGATQGTCGVPQMPPAPDGGAGDGGPNLCSQVGQACSTVQPCCTGLVCTPPAGTGACAPGEAGCTCYGTIG
jgi:hypothetical protein